MPCPIDFEDMIEQDLSDVYQEEGDENDALPVN
jgi:hypothetical protein